MKTNNKIYDQILKICERLTRVETRQKDTLLEIQTIKNNELPHLDRRINKLEKTVWFAIGAIALLSFGIQVYLRIR